MEHAVPFKPKLLILSLTPARAQCEAQDRMTYRLTTPLHALHHRDDRISGLDDQDEL
jgi:hypothetical protein